MFKKIRVTLLLFILVIVAGASYVTKLKSTSWKNTLNVVIYPINADGSEVARAHIAGLTHETFWPITTFITGEAKRHGLAITDPIAVWRGPEVKTMPPPPPIGASVPSIMWWSLKLRYWAGQNDASEHIPNIRLFALYHDPKRSRVLLHSLGLEKGMVGVVNVFASTRDAGGNNVVLAHEMLHTLGASDKYDFANNLPIYPQGYAEPAREPRYPQERAEVMAGRMAVSATKAVMPEDLAACVIGEQTARELNWLKVAP